MTKPLDGVTVLDLTRLLPGPAATMMLANFGAEVIKIEEPGKGDYAREGQPRIHDLGASFALLNRGKKSVAINLKDPRGKDAFRRLAATADVLIEGFRPGVMDRLDLGYEQLSGLNPRLIYAALTGYGLDGSYTQTAGHDANYLAMAGVLDLIGPAGGPAQSSRHPNRRYSRRDFAGGHRHSARPGGPRENRRGPGRRRGDARWQPQSDAYPAGSMDRDGRSAAPRRNTVVGPLCLLQHL